MYTSSLMMQWLHPVCIILIDMLGTVSCSYSLLPILYVPSPAAVTTEEPSTSPPTTVESIITSPAAVTTEEPSTSPPQTTVATTIPPLTVSIVSSGGTLRAGQNHILTCEASRDESMAYTYMWLKDGSVLSGQTSSTYSFSPLLVVHSGRYSCRVIVGSMNVTSEGVDITVESKSRTVESKSRK